MTIRIPLSFKGSKSEQVLYALFDTGSTYSCVREDLALKLGPPDKLPEPRFFTTASDNHYLKVESRIGLDFEIKETTLTDEFMVVPQLSEEVIIGVTTLQKWRIKLDFDHDDVIVDPRVGIFMLKKILRA
jgi:predicted aspartyl protease